jgi:hypothetical protein
MCPFCFATLGLVVAGTVSTGGLAALAMKVSCKRKTATAVNPDGNERSSENVSTHSR